MIILTHDVGNRLEFKAKNIWNIVYIDNRCISEDTYP